MEKMTHNKQQGFTLIELMIVVAIIGILAAVALPAYQDYTKRGHVSEGLNLASAAKASVAEYYATQGAFPTTNTLAGMAPANEITGNAVTSVEVGTGGIITVTYNAKVAATDNTIVFTPTAAAGTDGTPGNIVWSCAGGSVEDKYRPSNCRGS
ncbi:pilin [Pseudoalteromonas sp. T1lg22]|uniref:pilin n=1 Tax=Pseudoalteromonas sp. T1lg22 TaxID=2077096 RepID=UPI000CF6FAA7|nr:pilin [Pseudoalteromonas sp. T1lg22]